MPNSLDTLINNNRRWAEKIEQENPDFFEFLAKGQSPEYLWIGCADSRVPSTQITDLPPGSMFVHRNIANVVIHTDTNLLSVVFYAVTVLKVKHIIVCGHYGCGGVQAAMERQSHGFIDNWLMHIKDVYQQHREKLDAISDDQQRARLLVELNVIEQVHNVARISFIQKAWKEGSMMQVHGIVYDVRNGLLQNLNTTLKSVEDLEPVYHV